MRIISLVAAAAIAGGTLLVAQPAQAACLATQTPSTTADWSDNCTVSTTKNKTSDLTTAIQSWLNAKGFWLTIDGVYGSETKTQVIEAQKWLFPKDSSQWDGVVGPKTWAKMDNYLEGYLPTKDSSYYLFDVKNSELGQGAYALYRKGDKKGEWATRKYCDGSKFAPMDSSRATC